MATFLQRALVVACDAQVDIVRIRGVQTAYDNLCYVENGKRMGRCVLCMCA